MGVGGPWTSADTLTRKESEGGAEITLSGRELCLGRSSRKNLRNAAYEALMEFVKNSPKVSCFSTTYAPNVTCIMAKVGTVLFILERGDHG